MTRRVWAVVAAAALAACSSGSNAPPVTTSATSTTTTPSTTSASTTAVPCAGALAPSTVVRATHVSADVDGNGSADDVTVFGAGTDLAPGPWYVGVDLGAEGRRVAPISDADPDDPSQKVRVMGVWPAGGTPVVFVAVGTGASATIVGLFQLVGCSLSRVLTTNDSPATFTIGGTVTHLDGLHCRTGPALDILAAKSNDGAVYTGTVTAAAVAEGRITTEPPAVVDPIATPDVDGYGRLACPGVEPL